MMHHNFVECESIDQTLRIEIRPAFQDRATAVAKLAINAYEFSQKKDFHFAISTTDRPTSVENLKTYNFSTITENYTETAPDFLFDCWRQVDIDDYDLFTERIMKWGAQKPSTNKIGWTGAATSEVRQQMLDNCKNINFYKKNCDFQIREKQKGNFISFEEQIKKWNYLIDAEGIGWSARLKLLFFSNRVVFLIDRPYKEFFFRHIKPWVHFVPVSRDLSDFESNYTKLATNRKMEQEIKKNALEFAKNNLRRKHAIQHLAKIMDGLI